MELLIRARPVIVAIFFASIIAVGVGAYANAQIVFRGAGLLAHLALMLFVLTESFGRLSLKRSKTSRIIARTFLVLYALMFSGLAAQLVMMSLSS